MWQGKPYEKREDPGDKVGDEVSVFIPSILIQMNTSIWVMAFKSLQNEKLKGSEKQNSTTGFTVIKVDNETNWNG